ncbi:MAG: diaminopimelate decarboxylase [Oscillospiraceae bacterium]|nr:diaminopimelate decarboxylase [Oscillospiraceae bacterium]MDD4413559.1 diaminopimelate decarboxylase [Oscillospiraceae bacterium]
MFDSASLNVNSQGHLVIGGCDTVSLANRYGTPLYLMDETAIRTTLQGYKKSVDDNLKNGGMVAYASKACSFKEIYRIVMQEDCGIDVVSGGELYTAMQVGFPAERIFLHGNNKSDMELRMALNYGVGRIVVDNLTELKRLSDITKRMGKSTDIYLRITPGIEAHTHDFIRTGQIDSKFGITLENGDGLRAVKEAVKLNGITLKGLHCHIGSQIFDEKPFIFAAQTMLKFMAEIREITGLTLCELDLGGGFGVKYTEKDNPKKCADYMYLVSEALKEAADKLNFPMPYIVIEPGRSVVASSGITLYTIGSIKDIPGVRSYISIDGGMTDNPRYALYKAPYTALIANKANLPADSVYTIAGRCCESGDLIQENAILQSCQRGDILAVLSTGAYNYSMSSNYNRLPRPAVIMIKDGDSRVVVKAEDYEDIVRNDL